MKNDSTVSYIKHADLQPGPDNRPNRSGMDAKSIGELAASILSQGVVEPLIVRPAPKGAKASYEIVCGERRWTAFGHALKTLRLKDGLPCLIRDYTDSQVREIRLIENLQREGISPVEEAAGYRELLEMRDAMQRPLHTIEDIAKRVGKSMAYIYGRLKMLDMPELALKALMSGKLNASVALLIARIPDPKAARKATLEVLGRNTDETVALDPWVDPMSFRAAKAHIQDHYMVRLKGAPFNPDDDTLVPACLSETPDPATCHVARLSGGSCRDCPHRTGNMKALFPDVDSADVCTHPACFKKKKDAAFKRDAAARKANHETLLKPAQAARLLNWEGNALSTQARADWLDLRETVPGKKITWETALEKVLPDDVDVTVAGGKKKLLLLPLSVALPAIKSAGIKFTPLEKTGHDPEAERRQQAERETRKREHGAVAAVAHKLLLDRVRQPKYARHVHDHAYAAALYRPGSSKDWKIAVAKVRRLDAAELAAALFINEFMDAGRYVDWQGNYNDDFLNLCANFHVDLKSLAK